MQAEIQTNDDLKQTSHDADPNLEPKLAESTPSRSSVKREKNQFQAHGSRLCRIIASSSTRVLFIGFKLGEAATDGLD